ncbi:hypothetical protein NE237_030351 [Protea cynaroides]|uniref:Probable purine permease n=1 Tax=Protea cynaroides TaxID=273540 RepID=A0A9Q0GTX0_9MAGN|nr:hypothetical protein NE237_030351 [Protea cynaroides]
MIASAAAVFVYELIPEIFAYADNFLIQKFPQAQSIVAPSAYISTATLILHLFLTWLAIYKLGLGLIGASLVLSLSWWIVVVAQFVYIVKTDLCKYTWIGFTIRALSGLGGFLKLSVSSVVMFCLETWYMQILVLLATSKQGHLLQRSLRVYLDNTGGIEDDLPSLSITFLGGFTRNFSNRSAGTKLAYALQLYYTKGGNSKWMQTIVGTAGVPFLLPLLIYFSLKPSVPNQTNTPNNSSPSIISLAFLYAFFGIFNAGANLMYAYGLLYLPVSTYSLVCATQLAFNALFSYFLNSLKLTPALLNSVVVLTISASLLALHSESYGSTGIMKAQYVIGFLCTLVVSALSSLLLSLTQFSFEKILRKKTFSVILEMLIYPSMVAACVCVVGLFASGEWKSLKGEMEQIGGVSYVMILAWTAVAWTVFSVGALGLIFEVSSLFTNVIGTVALPILPIFGVMFFHDKMDGVKVVAFILALWGFISYMYQNYLDYLKSKALAS